MWTTQQGDRIVGEWYGDSAPGIGTTIPKGKTSSWHKYPLAADPYKKSWNKGAEIYEDGSWFRGKIEAGNNNPPVTGLTGEGVYFHANTGLVFIGTFKNGYKQQGKLTSPHGWSYEGPLENFQPHGHGVFRIENGTVYEGGFRNGQKHGLGTLTSLDGKVVKGIWESGLFKGLQSGLTPPAGKAPEQTPKSTAPDVPPPAEPPKKKAIQLPDGSSFTGEMQNGWPVRGTATHPNGDVYEGSYKGGKKNGWGIYRWRDGKRYVGTYANGERHGQGTLYYPGGDRYEGLFVHDKMNDFGTYYYSDGNKYTGNFLNGKKHGRGKAYFRNGDRYEGLFDQDKMHGYGIYYYSNGRMQRGVWERDRYVGSRRRSHYESAPRMKRAPG